MNWVVMGLHFCSSGVASADGWPSEPASAGPARAQHPAEPTENLPGWDWLAAAGQTVVPAAASSGPGGKSTTAKRNGQHAGKANANTAGWPSRQDVCPMFTQHSWYFSSLPGWTDDSDWGCGTSEVGKCDSIPSANWDSTPLHQRQRAYCCSATEHWGILTNLLNAIIRFAYVHWASTPYIIQSRTWDQMFFVFFFTYKNKKIYWSFIHFNTLQIKLRQILWPVCDSGWHADPGS